MILQSMPSPKSQERRWIMQKHIDSLADLLDIIQKMSEYLVGKIQFTKDGWPIFERKHLLLDLPEKVITCQYRNTISPDLKSKTLLCFFSADSRIYPRFLNLFDELDEYKCYLGVAAPDITVTWDMDIELQECLMLANQLFLAVLAVNGVKVVFNTRCGSANTQKCFHNIPRNAMWISGFLGCSTAKSFYEADIYVAKILRLLPCQLIIYGKHDHRIDSELNMIGLDYYYYADYRSLSKKEVA
jgi:hypothetical protein